MILVLHVYYYKRLCQVQREQPSQARRQQQPRTWRPSDSLRYYGRSWPKVVGLTAIEAKRRIEGDCPGVYCQIVSVNQMLTMCYCSGRVRLLVDRNGKVVKTPRVG